MHLLFILYRVKLYTKKSKNMRKKKGSLGGHLKHETLRTNNIINIQLIICRKQSFQTLLFHNFLFLTLQLIYIEHKYAVITQSSAHKVKHTHHSNTKHRERLRDMGLRVHYLHPCFPSKYLIYLIIQIISSLKFTSFSEYAIVMKNNFTGMIELCLHVCVFMFDAALVVQRVK